MNDGMNDGTIEKLGTKLGASDGKHASGSKYGKHASGSKLEQV